MMKLYRIAVLVVFAAVTAVFGNTYITNLITTDKTYPVISIEDEMLELSVDSDDEAFLDGVTATDGKDGDITENIIVESVSKFIKPGVCKVTYSVCDADNHVATAVRKVTYTDYVSPQYVLNESLCFSVEQSVNLKDVISVNDCFDGNLNSGLILTSADYTGATEGVFTIDATVTNSKGDTAAVAFPVIVEKRSPSAPKIELTQYLVYLEKGEEIDTEQFIVSAVDYRDKNITDDITIDTNLNIDKEGTYIVHYYAVDNRGERGHSTLIVIVGNGK